MVSVSVFFIVRNVRSSRSGFGWQGRFDLTLLMNRTALLSWRSQREPVDGCTEGIGNLEMGAVGSRLSKGIGRDEAQPQNWAVRVTPNTKRDFCGLDCKAKRSMRPIRTQTRKVVEQKVAYIHASPPHPGRRKTFLANQRAAPP